MPRKSRKFICEICGDSFLSNSRPPVRSCSKKECRHKIKSLTTKRGHCSNKWLNKTCLFCGKKFETRISREANYCSALCYAKSEEKKNNLSNRYKNKTLKERGWDNKAIEKDRQIKIEKNKKMTGKTFEELYGKRKAEEIKNKLKEVSSSSNNPMSYEKVMERENISSFEEARKLMPATNRNGELHPMYGKHHTVESKIKMMKTFEKNLYTKSFCANGYFDNIFWQGSWELKYIIDCIENNVPIKRYDLPPLEYIYENEIHHYFPDFIINNDEIIEIKGMDKKNGRTIYKNKQFKKKFSNKYKILYNVGQNLSANVFYKLMKEKYSDRLEINYNPHEVEID